MRVQTTFCGSETSSAVPCFKVHGRKVISKLKNKETGQKEAKKEPRVKLEVSYSTDKI